MERGRFRRILLALDASPDDPRTLDRAARLAAHLQAELRGLHVENPDLLSLADHPAARTVSTRLVRRQSLDAGHVERLLRLQAAASRRAIEDAARRRNVRATFDVRRGRITAEVIEEAGDADLVVIGWSCGDLLTAQAPSRRPSAHARQVAERADPSVLVLHPESPADGPVMVAYDGTGAARAALGAAAEIAGDDGGRLDVALVGASPDETDAWHNTIVATLEPTGVEPMFLSLPGGGIDIVAEAARQRQASLLVLGAASRLLEGGIAERLSAEIGCSVLLVR